MRACDSGCRRAMHTGMQTDALMGAKVPWGSAPFGALVMASNKSSYAVRLSEDHGVWVAHDGQWWNNDSHIDESASWVDMGTKVPGEVTVVALGVSNIHEAEELRYLAEMFFIMEAEDAARLLAEP